MTVIISIRLILVLIRTTTIHPIRLLTTVVVVIIVIVTIARQNNETKWAL